MSHGRGHKGKAHSGPVNVLPKYLTDSDELRQLPAHACKLLLAMLPRYNGRGTNNGSLLILMRQPRRCGFASVETLTAARDALIRHGFIQITLHGGRNRAAQYALTWVPVDVAGLDVRADTKASDLWLKKNESLRENPSPRRQKNSFSVPVSGAREPTTAPISGTQGNSIAPVVGAVRSKKEDLPAPISGTCLGFAMGGARSIGSPRRYLPGFGPSETAAPTSPTTPLDRLPADGVAEVNSRGMP